MAIAHMSDAPFHNTSPAATDYALPVRIVEALAASLAPLAPTAGSVTRVTATTVAQSMLAVNTNRKGAVFANTGTTSMMLRFATGAITLTNFSVVVSQFGQYTLPMPPYTGPIAVIWTAASGVGEGNATEWT